MLLLGLPWYIKFSEEIVEFNEEFLVFTHHLFYEILLKNLIQVVLHLFGLFFFLVFLGWWG